ncbi:hypothetical protein GF312_18375, partial [Candidatus Poribacteria bacterium]|nr:hypothetical protein [Candidatus Poribacteria bacterium]
MEKTHKSSDSILYLISLLLILLFLTVDITPAQDEEDKSDPQQENQKNTVSITTGSGGKVNWFFSQQMGTAHGDAVVVYEDVTLKADHVWADLRREVVEAQGNVILEMKDQTILAESMIFDLKDKRGIMRDGTSFDRPWYNSGDEMTRLTADDSYIEKGSMTSCSLSEPHYVFEASKIVIHLKKELIAKHVVFKVGGIPMLYLPVYRRSLEEEKPSRFIFKLGSNTYEGYYVKNILPVRWRMLDGSLFLNYTTRRGTSGGLEFDYDADKISLREIFIPVPEDASSSQWLDTRKEIENILQRATGELDKIWLKQIFIKFQISEAEKEETRERVQELMEKLNEEDSEFSQLARRWSDDKDTKSRGGYLGPLENYVIDENGISKKIRDETEPVPSFLYPVIKTAYELQPNQLSEPIETKDGYFIVKLEGDDKEKAVVRYIFLEFRPSDKAQEDAQNEADDILTKLSEGVSFEELAREHSDHQESASKGGDLGWTTFQELDISFHRPLRRLNKGDISRPINTQRGVYILKLEDKEPTPDFGELAKQLSKAPTAEVGGDIGYRNKWELQPEVRKEAFRTEIGNITRPIKCEDGYRIVKIEKKRRLGGDVYLNYGELYSYQIDDNPIKLGRTWDVNIHHNQTLWRGGERKQYDTATRQEKLLMEKALAMRAELSLAGKEYKQVYQSYRPEQELRSYCAFDYYWMSKHASRGSARLIVDGTRDLLGEDTGLLQKYPDFSLRLPRYRLNEIQPFKRANSGLLYISDRIQGKSRFSNLARQFSDDPSTRKLGGDLGWFRKGESGLGSKVEADIFDPNKLEPGDISEPISVTGGYQIVKVEDVKQERGQRIQVKARHIFIAIDPNIRTKDEASKLSDIIYRKLDEGSRPSLGFITLNNTSVSFDTNVGNYYKDEYRDENNIWLQTADASTTLSKRAIIRLGVTREFNLDLDGTYRQIWHSKTQPLGNSLIYLDEEEIEPSWDFDEREYNVFSNAWNASARLSTDLHRIYYPSFVPGLHALKHTVRPSIGFTYAPPGESEKRQEEIEPSLYPFGSAVWTYERKRLTVSMTNSIDIKTKKKRERISLFRWNLSAGADYTEDKDSDRRYDRVRNTFTLTPNKQWEFGTVLENNPNNFNNEKPFLITVNTDARYSAPERKWTAYLRRQSVYYQYGDEWRQFFSGKLNLRLSRIWSLRCELEYEYDDRVKDISNLSFSFHRTLHCWESRIVFRRRGTKDGRIRRDFMVQLNILADPGKALGIGYDDASDSWNLRSIPG